MSCQITYGVKTQSGSIPAFEITEYFYIPRTLNLDLSNAHWIRGDVIDKEIQNVGSNRSTIVSLKSNAE